MAAISAFWGPWNAAQLQGVFHESALLDVHFIKRPWLDGARIGVEHRGHVFPSGLSPREMFQCVLFARTLVRVFSALYGNNIMAVQDVSGFGVINYNDTFMFHFHRSHGCH